MNDRITVEIDRDLDDLILEYLIERVRDVKWINEALEQINLDTIRIIGHDMKGTGGGYGFDLITEIGAAIEIAANTNDTKEIRKQVTDLTDYLERVEVVYIEEEE